uniref:Putative lipocalin-3 1 n=1 Tax=Amblyomma cajennense TaxID=34607 RepID=A0A023FTX0_AMBCJ
MVEARICSALLFPLLLTAVLAFSNEEEQEPTADIEKFLRENKKVWVYHTTEPSKVTCRLDEYINVNISHARFSRYFVDNARKEEKNLIGKFLDWEGGVPPLQGKYDAMEINDIEKPMDYPLSYDVYEFQGKDGKCAVVAVIDNSAGTTETWLDLRVSDSVIEEGPAQDCKAQFERILRIYPERKRVSRKSYESQCKNWF